MQRASRKKYKTFLKELEVKNEFFLILNLFILTFFSCTPSYYESISTREALDNKITARFIRQMKSQGFSPCGFGGAEKEGKTTELAVSFNTQQMLDIKTGRRVIVSAINQFLEMINSDEEYRNYIVNACFFPKNIDMAIFPLDPESGDTRYVEYISAYKGLISYEGTNPNPEELRSITLHEETYEEAVEILKKEGAFS